MPVPGDRTDALLIEEMPADHTETCGFLGRERTQEALRTHREPSREPGQVEKQLRIVVTGVALRETERQLSRLPRLARSEGQDMVVIGAHRR